MGVSGTWCNYDIKGCQLEILRHELLSIGIPAKSLEMLETQYICRVLRIAEKLVKQFRFSSVFNSGFVTLSLKSSTRRMLNRELGQEGLNGYLNAGSAF